MQVTEIFFSIQGESTHAGRPCVFVRFTGCDLRCTWCDSAYAFHGGRKMSQEEILADVARHPTRFVCLTGGEPLLQKELPALCDALLARGYFVSVETHGQIPFGHLPREVARIVDVKCPGSGEEMKDFSPLADLGPNDQVKIVVAGEADFRWAEALVKRLDLCARTPVLFSAAHGQVEPRDLARWLLESGLDARLQLQLHKYIWGPDVRGV